MSEAASDDALPAERSRAHFYVLCPACGGGMRPGKLRVRCSECGEGAIVVHRDPCDWDDVLVAGRVAGTCSNAECGVASVYVEFYFKVFSRKGEREQAFFNLCNVLVCVVGSSVLWGRAALEPRPKQYS